MMMVAVVVLFILMLTVLAIAFIGRWRLNRYNRRKEVVRSRLGDLIVQYISGDCSINEVRGVINSKLDYVVLLEIAKTLEESLSSEGDHEKLAALIEEPAIKKFYRKRMRSGDKYKQAKACIYFSRCSSLHPDWIPRLLLLSADSEPTLAYAATLALLKHGEIGDKEKALGNALINPDLSLMALGDLFVKFTHHGAEYHVEEMQVITGFISGKNLSDERKALMIQILDELEYFHSMDFLTEYYRTSSKEAMPAVILTALIRILTKFGIEEILPDIHRHYVLSDATSIREVAAWSMGFFKHEESIPFLKWLMNDSDFNVRFQAVKSICSYPRLNQDTLKSMVMNDSEWASLLGEIQSGEVS